MSGLDWRDLSGPKVDRRTLLRLLGATGFTYLAACAPGVAPTPPTPAPPEAKPAAATAKPGPTTAEAARPTAEAKPAAGTPKRGGTLIAGWNQSDFATLDPAFINLGEQMEAACNICTGLVRITPNVDVEGDLAENWEVSKDGKEYVFFLRKGVTFHNGDKFTARDVKASLDRILDKDLGSPHRSKIADVLEAAEVVDDTTFRVRLKQPFSPFLAAVATGFPGRSMTVISLRAYQEMGKDRFGQTPVGTGPFKVVKHQPAQELVLERHPDYYESGQPYLDRVVIKFIKEPQALAAALQAGDVHFVNHPPETHLEQLKRDPNIVISSVSGTNWFGLQMNYKRKPLDDPKVRMALAKAIDREELVQKGYFGDAVAATGVLNPAVKWAYRAEKPNFPQRYDPEAAKKLLSEAGVTSLEVVAPLQAYEQRWHEVLRDQLSRVGVRLKLEIVDTAIWRKRWVEGDYDVLFNGSVTDPDPDESIWNFFYSQGPWNGFGYKSEKADALLKAQRLELDKEKRAKILWELEDLLTAEAVVGWGIHRKDTTAFRKNVQGWVHVPELRFFKNVWLA